jgi:predicted negative regulator of RcsB-dependent stress response
VNDLRDQDNQLEALKSWWEENGRATIVGVVVALALVFGWQGWSRHQESRAEQAALAFQELLEADQAAARNPRQRETARHLAQELRDEYRRMVYGQFGALYQAKYAAQEQDWQTAEEALRWILEQRPDAVMEQQVRVRLGRVLLGQGRHNEAREVLVAADTGAFAAQVAELRGDIYHAQGRNEQALAAYQQARQALTELGQGNANPLLELKIRDLQPAQEHSLAEDDE